MHVFKYFYSVQASFFYSVQASRLVLCSNYNVTTMLLIHPQLITAIKLCNGFKVTIGLMVKSLSGILPLQQLS